MHLLKLRPALQSHPARKVKQERQFPSASSTAWLLPLRLKPLLAHETLWRWKLPAAYTKAVSPVQVPPKPATASHPPPAPQGYHLPIRLQPSQKICPCNPTTDNST